MKDKIKLITGAGGEIGQALINKFNGNNIITLDLSSVNIQSKTHIHYMGSILDTKLLKKINNNYQIEEIYHLAAILSTKAENNPTLATQVNITGTNNIYNLCLSQAQQYTSPIKLFFPSSIATYNILNQNDIKNISENQCYKKPKTIYGQSKLISEKQGIKYSKLNNLINFRCIRFPGIISSETIPTGGTSDYASEMIHAAILEKEYSCFVKPNTKLPFIVMPDAINAITQLIGAPQKSLSTTVYNVTSFSPTVLDIANKIREFFPKFAVNYNINKHRQKIVDSWPNNIDDSIAQRDWGWEPKYNFDNAFANYIIPNLFKHYKMKDKL